MKTLNMPRMTLDTRETHRELANAEVTEALRAAIERCPEHAATLRRINEREWMKQLYAEAHASLRDRYRELAAEHLDLRRQQSEQNIRFAMVAEFVSIMTQRLDAPVRALEGLVSRLRKPGAVVGNRDRAHLAEHLARVERVVQDLAQVSAVMQQTKSAESAFHDFMSPERIRISVETTAPAMTEMQVPIASEARCE